MRAFGLRLAVPETEPASLPKQPHVRGPGNAPSKGADSVNASIDLPFFAVGDTQFDAFLDQMLASPTYTLLREDIYTLIPDCLV